MSEQQTLQQYFGNYLAKVRNNKPSTIKHYFDALNNISRFLNEKGMLKNDIYSIKDIDALLKLRDILYNDPDFTQYNKVGHSMYSAGFNHYIKFAQAEGFRDLNGKAGLLDIPIASGGTRTTTITIYERSTIIRKQAIELAQYKCEIGPEHESFIAKSNLKPYMEGHHAIPVSKQEKFAFSLDVYANVVCLCPFCHRKLHYGVDSDKEAMLDKLYFNRRERLLHSGFDINKDDFVRLATNR